MAFEIEFYTSEDGREPVAEFLDSLDFKSDVFLLCRKEDCGDKRICKENAENSG